MSSITYHDRPPDPQDYLDLFETTGWNQRYQADLPALSRALDGSWYVVSAYDGHRLVGMGRVVSDGALYAMIYDLIVRPSHQGRGIGSTILRKLVEKCQAAGVREIQLFAAKGTIPFYNKRGFVERPADAPGMRWKKEQDRTCIIRKELPDEPRSLQVLSHALDHGPTV
jgi:GNAT superfamily N-acetyltransferase